MKDPTMVKGGFWGGVIGAATGLLGCAFGALSYFGIGPDAVKGAMGGWLHAAFPFAMFAFGFLFGFSVRHIAAGRHAARTGEDHAAAPAGLEAELSETRRAS